MFCIYFPKCQYNNGCKEEFLSIIEYVSSFVDYTYSFVFYTFNMGFPTKVMINNDSKELCCKNAFDYSLFVIE